MQFIFPIVLLAVLVNVGSLASFASDGRGRHSPSGLYLFTLGLDALIAIALFGH